MKTNQRIISAICLIAVLRLGSSTIRADEQYDKSIQAFLNENFAHANTGMVVGLVDQQGTKVFAAGKLDNGTDREVDGDTVFEIGSTTKTFTSLLLLEMVQRDKMKLDDPVAKYLPDSVKVPSRNGKEITLLNLAAQDSGLPFNADNHTGTDWGEKFATYTVGNMYEFLSRYRLTQDPGEKFQYSNIGMGVLGHVMSLSAERSYEDLVVERICRPLGMDSTCITLSPELKSRLAMGHDAAWKPTANFELPTLAGAGALRSTMNDLLKYTAAQLALIDSPLTPLMQQTHVIRHNAAKVRDQFEGHTAMPWFDEGIYMPPGSQLLGHAGGTGGYNSFVGFDLTQRRGVVVLTNQLGISSSMFGWRILQRARLEGIDARKMMPQREMVGLGIALDLDQKSGTPRISSVFPNSPAAQSGLSAGLLMQKVDDTATAGKSLADCLNLIRGPAGAKLRLELVDSQGKVSSIELTRAKFLLDS